jgi:hypothetical protein
MNEAKRWDESHSYEVTSMHFPFVASLVGIFLLGIVPGQAGTLENEPINVQPSVKTTTPWEIKVSGPGWLAGVNGTIGSHGVTTHVDMGFVDIIKRTNFIAALEADVRRGRLGAYGGFLYLDAQASTGRSGLINKIDLGLQEYLGEFGLSYRVLQAPQGWFEILAGFRSVYLGDQTTLQANQANIDAASTELVNRFAQQVVTPGSNLNTLIRQTIDDRLSSLAGRNPPLPIPPLAGRLTRRDTRIGPRSNREPPTGAISGYSSGSSRQSESVKSRTRQRDFYSSNEPPERELFSL